ncbi:MAG: hypothetical protein N838_19000 [Thiohalocapsa sp. PB-PSB1]|nr:MAG: hypothetical protein N838_30305 [Thiohalocapsa sp. PB-PSB1]QQO55121.1 MAG: hypothetical protein N838_19000 [Thiohalocapsa sp. PB-PSB1]
MYSDAALRLLDCLLLQAPADSMSDMADAWLNGHASNRIQGLSSFAMVYP